MDTTSTGPLDRTETQAPASEPSQRSDYQRAVLALTLVTFVWRAWTTSRWSWYSDDWVYMADTRSMSFGHYLFQDYNGHFMPAGFLVSWMVTKAAPLEFWLPVVLVASAAALNTWLWGRALAAVAGERLLLVLPLGLLVLSPLMIRPTIWWASALQVLPLQISLALVVLAATRLASSGSRRDLGMTALALLVGLVFWEKALLLVIPLVAVLLHRGPGPLRSRLRRQAVPLATVAGLSVVYLAVYALLTRTAEGDREMGVRLDAHRSAAQHVEFFVRGLGDLLAPALLGGPWHTMPIEGDALARPPAVVAGVSLAVVLLAAVWALWRFERAYIPVLMTFAYYVVSSGLVLYSGRFDVLGAVSISDERYLADPLAVAVLAVAMVVGSPVRHRPRTRSPAVRTAVQWSAAAVALALVVSLVVANVSAAMRIGTRPSRTWVDNVTSDVARHEPVVLLDAYSPPEVLQQAFFAEEARLSRILAPLHADLAFGGPAEQLWFVDDDGHLQKAQVGDAAHAVPGDVEGCGYSIGPGDVRTIALTQDLYAWEWVVQVNTLAGDDSTLTVDLGGETPTTIDVAKGIGQNQFAFTGPVPAQITVSMPDGAPTVCMSDLVVGTVSAG